MKIRVRNIYDSRIEEVTYSNVDEVRDSDGYKTFTVVISGKEVATFSRENGMGYDIIAEDTEITNATPFTLTLPRLTVLDIKLALLGVCFDHEDEARNPETSETRRGICLNTVKKWRGIYDEVGRQFDAQDKRN